MENTAKSAVVGVTIPAAIQLFPDKKLQEADGFGGCFNEIGWKALFAVTPEAGNKTLQELFSARRKFFYMPCSG